jgi:hypothetical protein
MKAGWYGPAWANSPPYFGHAPKGLELSFLRGVELSPGLGLGPTEGGVTVDLVEPHYEPMEFPSVEVYSSAVVSRDCPVGRYHSRRCT